jgi:hypothetical protein
MITEEEMVKHISDEILIKELVGRGLSVHLKKEEEPQLYSGYTEDQKNSEFTILNLPQIEVLRISAEGITANPDIPVDDAARAVLDALVQYFTPEVWELINKAREKNNV